MNIVELELDETLADFEIQDWIDNVFSVQYPEIKAKIKHGCSGLCHKNKDDKNEQISVMETTITQAKQVIKYLLQSLKIEGYDFSQSGSATDEYRFYKMAIKILGEDNEIHD